MIYAAALPIEKYSVVMGGHQFGLYDTYINRPTLLALICMTTPLPFDYEGCRELGNRRVELSPETEEALSQTLATEFCGRTVEEHLTTLTPLEFYELIQSALTINLPVVNALLRGSERAFRLITCARATAWALNYRGKVPSKGKTINIAFRGLTVSSAMRQDYETVKKELTV